MVIFTLWAIETIILCVEEYYQTKDYYYGQNQIHFCSCNNFIIDCFVVERTLLFDFDHIFYWSQF